MATLDDCAADRERRLDEAVAEYLEMQAAEQLLDRHQWLARYPDLADELAQFLDDLDRVNSAVIPVRAKAIDKLSAESLPSPSASREPEEQPIQVDTSIHIPIPAGSSSQRYRLGEFYARGGMGEIWLADDTRIGRRIAVKKLRGDRVRNADEILQERFLFEAQVMGQLEHPCIVPLHDLGVDEAGELFCVMKLVQGSSLKSRLQAFHAAKSGADWPRQVEFVRLLEAFVSVCRAVAYAHSRGVLHRDIKPDNIMLGSYGEAMLLDWGLAKLLSQPEVAIDSLATTAPVRLTLGSSTATQAGAVLGSPAYMPPELAAGRAHAVDFRTDVYLLGATLYEIVTGRPPREGSSRLELLDRAQSTPPASPRRFDTRIPRALEAICLRSMAHRAEQRYASATLLAEEIERFLAGEPVQAYREPIPLRAWRWLKRHRHAMLRSLAGLLMVAISVMAWSAYTRAQLLAQREAVRQELAEFRALADETQYFAASTDPVAEHAPYYDPQSALRRGNEALQVASAWGKSLEQFPLQRDRAAVAEELYDLLLILANLHQQSVAQSPEALRLLDRAVTIHPSSRAYHQIRSRCLVGLGQTVEAEQESHAAHEPGTLTTAQDYFLQGEFYRADSARRADELVEVAASQPQREAVLQAVAAYRRAIELDPRQYWAHFQLARCYLSLQRGPEAVQALGTCVALRPQSPWAYSTRGLTQALLGQFAEAHADFARALRWDPDFRPARLNRGFTYYLQNQDDLALEDFDAVLEPPAERCLSEAAYYRAHIRYRRGEFGPAGQDCAALLLQRPGFAPAYWLQARIRFRLGEDAVGLRDLDAYLARGSGTTFDAQRPEYRVARAKALRQIAVDLDPVSRLRILNLALAELETAVARGAVADKDVLAVKDLLGSTTETIDQYSRQLATTPHDATLLKQRGYKYMTLQNYQLAAADFQAALQENPGDPSAHSYLGLVLASQGDVIASECQAASAALHGANGYLVLHNVACIYALLASADVQQSARYEELALVFLDRAVELFRQNPNSVDEIEQIRGESVFSPALRARPEFQRLLGERPH